MSGPLVLGFDTSGPWVAAALWQNGAVVEAVGEEMARGQAERLISLLEEVLARHAVTWACLDALGVGVGPGNFTGIRIGVSAARGLALGLGIPAYGVHGFDQRQMIFGAGVVAAVPAPRDHVYVMQDGTPALLPRADVEGIIPDAPAPDALATAIATLAAARFPAPATAPAPMYVRAADAAPARDTGLVIL